MNAHLAFLLSAVYEGNLHPAHRADLEKSGITEASRIEQGIRSVPPSDFARLLGFRVPTAVTSLMLLPYPDPAGGYFDMFQVKLFSATEDAKYLQPRDSPPRLYFVRHVLPSVTDVTRPLYLVEGGKKALSVAQLGLAAVGFCGIEGWHARGSRDLLPDFDHVRLQDRVVELLPDGDWRTNPDVARGVARLHAALTRRGARSRLVDLPASAEAAR